MIRLFVAFPLPVNVLGQLQMMQSGLNGARWIDPKNMHLTIRFIGDVQEPDAQDIGIALSEIHEAPFNLRFSGIGYFAQRGKVHSIWAKVPRSNKLLQLQSKIDSTVVRAGGTVETRKFIPHVTLARLKNIPSERIGTWLEMQGNLEVSAFPITEFYLYQSERGSGGVSYTQLAKYPLGVLQFNK